MLVSADQDRGPAREGMRPGAEKASRPMLDSHGPTRRRRADAVVAEQDHALRARLARGVDVRGGLQQPSADRRQCPPRAARRRDAARRRNLLLEAAQVVRIGHRAHDVDQAARPHVAPVLQTAARSASRGSATTAALSMASGRARLTAERNRAARSVSRRRRYCAQRSGKRSVYDERVAREPRHRAAAVRPARAMARHRRRNAASDARL